MVGCGRSYPKENDSCAGNFTISNPDNFGLAYETLLLLTCIFDDDSTPFTD